MSDDLSAQEYRLLVENSPVLIWRAALNAECDYFNDTWLEFTGRSLAQEAGNGWTEGVHPEDLERCVAYYLDHFARREPFEMEYRLRRHDGVYRWIFDRGTPSFDDAGTFLGFIGSCIDIDDRRRAQAEREQAQLADAHSFEQWILGIVGHDIRNPLGAIDLAARVLQRSPDPTVVARTAERVLRGVDRITHIVSDLLDLSRERHGGGIPVSRAECNLQSICRQVIDELAASAKEHPIELVCDGDARGEWDSHRLTQAISNLVGNAVQHSPAGSPIVVAIDARGDEVAITVRNQGQIPPEILPAIFDAFRSGDEKVGRGQGLGLGLFIARAITRAHGGRIEVTSTAADGTRFCVLLPRRAAVAAAAPG